MSKKKVHQYTEWFSAEEMHEHLKNWLSELNFIEIECEFLEDLIRDYTLELIDSKHFDQSNKIVKELKNLEKEDAILINSVKHQVTQLTIMLDEVNQYKEEKTYLETHHQLRLAITRHNKKFRLLKNELFNLIKSIKKEQKNKRLLK